ncbi:MAG: HNH endonuclease [Pseudomonadota bacterium]
MSEYLDLSKLTKEAVQHELDLCLRQGVDEYLEQSPTPVRGSTAYFVIKNNKRLPVRAVVKRAIYKEKEQHGHVSSTHAYAKLRSLGFEVLYVPSHKGKKPSAEEKRIRQIDKRQRFIEKRQRYETTGWFRNGAAAKEAKRRAEYHCEACGFDFEKEYGPIGKEYLEAHHIEPLAIKKTDKNEITSDQLLALCANCHRMIHRLIRKDGKSWISVDLDTLKSHLKKRNVT